MNNLSFRCHHTAVHGVQKYKKLMRSQLRSLKDTTHHSWSYWVATWSTQPTIHWAFLRQWVLWWLCSLSQNDESGMKANFCLLAVFISVSESILQSLIHHLSLHQGISLDRNLPLPFSSNINHEAKALPPENELSNVQSQDTLVWKVTRFIPLPTAWLASELASPQFLLLLLKCLAPAASAWKLQHCPQFKQVWGLAYPNKVFFQANTNNKNRWFKLKRMYLLLVGCPDIQERETKLLPPA